MKMRHIFSIILAVVVFFIGIAYSSDARSASFEVGAGVDHYSIVSNGTWYQTGVPDYSLTQNGRPYLVGLTGDHMVTDRIGLAWHADYVNLGHARSYCYCTTIDADYNRITHALAPGAPMALYSGDGMVQGIKLSGAPYYTIGPYKVGAEFGLLYYRPTWVESVYGWPWVGHNVYINGVYHTPDNPLWGPYFGAFVKRGHWTVSYGYYWIPVHPNQYNVPPLYTGSQALILSYDF